MRKELQETADAIQHGDLDIRTEIRIADTDRDAAIAAIHEAFVAGRLTQEVTDRRVAAAIRADSRAQLKRLTQDIPLLATMEPFRARYPVPRKDYAAYGFMWLAAIFGTLAVALAHAPMVWLGVAWFLSAVTIMNGGVRFLGRKHCDWVHDTGCKSYATSVLIDSQGKRRVVCHIHAVKLGGS